jgi:hypothetical protein
MLPDSASQVLHISLTTISARLPRVHRVVASLLAQVFPQDAFDVTLYLSREPYLLDEGCPRPSAELADLLAASRGRFSIEYVPNTGPYRKILPILGRLYALPQAAFSRALVVTVDDDTLYPPDWLRGLYAAYQEHRCVVGYRGRSMALERGQVAAYRQWSRTTPNKPCLRTVLTGKDGILYSPLHLHPHVLNEQAALRVAPRADDLWLKAHALLLRVPAHAVHDTLTHEFPSVAPDAPDVSLYESFNRRGGNDEAIGSIGRHLSARYERTLADLVAQPWRAPRGAVLTL